MSQNILIDAKLNHITGIQFNAIQLKHWIDQLRETNPKVFEKDHYNAVFKSNGLNGKKTLIGCAGRACGMRISVSKNQILGQIECEGKTIESIAETLAPDATSIPFKKVFEVGNALMQKMRKIIFPAWSTIPLLGGVKSIILQDTLQEMVDFYLPKVALFGGEGEYWLFHIKEIEMVQLPTLTGLYTPKGNRIESFVFCPERKEYLLRMKRVMQKLEQGVVSKVVIARKCTAKFVQTLDMLEYADYLNKNYFQEYFYVFQQGGTESWIGIPPQAILKQKNGVAITTPQAGTRKKTQNKEENEALKKELQQSEKDIIEHESALNSILSNLQKADIGTVSLKREKEILETPYTFHLESEIAVALHPNCTFFDFLSAVYPPATVWGIPTAEAEQAIQEAEPFSREFYSGIFGYWTLQGTADFAVVLRSARIEGDTISFYAGGGIIRDSNPEEEWDETIHKLKPLMGYFET